MVIFYGFYFGKARLQGFSNWPVCNSVCFSNRKQRAEIYFGHISLRLHSNAPEDELLRPTFQTDAALSG